MQNKVIGFICASLAVLILILPDDASPPKPKPSGDIVANSFDTYEKLWRAHAIETADKIKAGDLKTDQEVWNYISEGQAPARKVAFDELAKKEQEYFDSNGGWTPELHESLLRGYSDE